MKAVAALMLALGMSACAREDTKDHQVLLELDSRVADLRTRMTALERKTESLAASARSPEPAASPPGAELRLTDGSNRPAVSYATMAACMRAKGEIDAQLADPTGRMLTGTRATCIPLS